MKTQQPIPELPKTPLDVWTSVRRVLSVTAIEALAQEVIDRLSQRDAANWTVTRNDLDTLCRFLCARYPFAADRMIDQLVQSGVSLERIHLSYLAEAARLLGERWQRDELNFEDVGIATTRIYVILDTLRRQSPIPVLSDSPRIAFAPLPGERHTLGVAMAVNAFRRAGWNVRHLSDHTHDQIVEAANDVDVLLVGLSASGRHTRTTVLKLVVALRVARPDLKILLSGKIADREPELLAQIGIDKIVKDIPSALKAVECLLRHTSCAGN